MDLPHTRTRCPPATLLTPTLTPILVELQLDLTLTAAVDALLPTLACHQWEPLGSLLTLCTTLTMLCTVTACHPVCHQAMVCLLATPGLTELALVEDTVADHLGVDQEADLQDTDPLVTDIDLLDTEATPPAGLVTLAEPGLHLTALAETT